MRTVSAHSVEIPQMTVVDTTVWIDYLGGNVDPHHLGSTES